MPYLSWLTWNPQKEDWDGLQEAIPCPTCEHLPLSLLTNLTNHTTLYATREAGSPLTDLLLKQQAIDRRLPKWYLKKKFFFFLKSGIWNNGSDSEKFEEPESFFQGWQLVGVATQISPCHHGYFSEACSDQCIAKSGSGQKRGVAIALARTWIGQRNISLYNFVQTL